MGLLPCHPETAVSLKVKRAIAAERQTASVRSNGVRHELTQLGLRGEYSTRFQDSLDFAYGLFVAPDMVTRAEIHNRIKGCRGYRDRSDVSPEQLDCRSQSGSPVRGYLESNAVNVQSHETFWRTKTMEHRKCDASSTSDLQKPRTPSKAEEVHEQRNFKALLPSVATRLFRKGSVVRL